MCSKCGCNKNKDIKENKKCATEEHGAKKTATDNQWGK